MHRFISDANSVNNAKPLILVDYKEIIRVSLQTLLNTKCNNSQFSELWPDAINTGLGYGMSHLVSMKENIKLNKTVLCRQIENIIQQYEPRLTNVSVSQSDSLIKNNVIGIMIEGTLTINIESQPITFESYIEPGEQRINIMKGVTL
jgi:type VI secretion system lysozyme-like protein